VQEETIAESADSSSFAFAPLTKRPAERIFGSGGQPIDKQSIDFDAVLTEGYDLLAAFFWEFGEASEVIAGEATPAAAQDEAMTAEESRNAARERAFEAEEPQPIADVPTPAPQPTMSPGRRVDASHQLAGKPAA
jgi:hypothetical protein